MRRADHVVVDAGGVGYRLAVSAETLKAVPARGKRATLHAHLVARDDALSLYGFASEEERDLFLQLISVSGVGPKVALAALSGGAGRASCCARSPPATPSASRRCRGSASGPPSGSSSSCARRSPARSRATPRHRRHRAGEEDPRSMAREGLLNLGYTPVEAERLLDAPRARAPRRSSRRRCERRRGQGGCMRTPTMTIEPGKGIKTPGVDDAEIEIHDARAVGATTTSTARCARRRSRTSSTRSRSPSSSGSSSRRRGAAGRRSTTSCSPARRGSARPRSRTSSPPSSRRRWCRPRARRSSARPTSPPS